MAINVEWIINKAKKKIYAISHAKAVVRGDSTVDADLSLLEESVNSHANEQSNSEQGAHGLRYHNGALQFKNETGWSGVSISDAATVNGHTVDTDVPANAKFTDTVYTHPSGTAKTGNPTANQTPSFGGTFTVTQFTSDSSGHISSATDRTVKIPNTYASASNNGLVSTGAQTFAGNKTFNGQIIPAGASAVNTAQARKIYAGTTDMTAGTSTLETGAIYLVYE